MSPFCPSAPERSLIAFSAEKGRNPGASGKARRRFSKKNDDYGEVRTWGCLGEEREPAVLRWDDGRWEKGWRVGELRPDQLSD